MARNIYTAAVLTMNSISSNHMVIGYPVLPGRLFIRQPSWTVLSGKYEHRTG